jgi:hypothetical protein
VVDLRAVRPARLAATLLDGPRLSAGRPLRPYLRGAVVEELADGVRLRVQLGLVEIAALAELVRDLADQWPFLDFRLLEAAPACWLEVRGQAEAADVARAVFAELGAAG